MYNLVKRKQNVFDKSGREQCTAKRQRERENEMKKIRIQRISK